MYLLLPIPDRKSSLASTFPRECSNYNAPGFPTGPQRMAPRGPMLMTEGGSRWKRMSLRMLQRSLRVLALTEHDLHMDGRVAAATGGRSEMMQILIPAMQAV